MPKKEYRNTLNQPLPIGLNSTSLSIAAKGYFEVEEQDWGSPSLLQRLADKSVKFIRDVPDPIAEVKTPEPEPVPSPPSEVVEQEGMEFVEDVNETSETEEDTNKSDDSLTSATEMVKLEDEDAGNVGDDESTSKQKQSKGGSKNRRKRKTTASRDKARS